MSAAQVHDDRYDDQYDEQSTPEPLGLAPDPVEVRRNAGLAALVGGVASAVAIAYLARAAATGAVVDWTLAVLMGVLGVAHLVAFVDARTPLLVADTQGVRIRLGRTWRGMPWGALSHVEHTPRRGFLRDGRLVLVARNPERVLAELDASGRRQSTLATRLYGAPFAVPLALTTRVSGAGEDLTVALVRLAGDAQLVVEVVAAEPALEDSAEDSVEEPAEDLVEEIDEVDEVDEVDETDETPATRWHDPRPALARGIGAVAARLQRDRMPVEDGEHTEPTETLPAVAASATPSPLREPVSAARIEVRSDLTMGATALRPDSSEDGTTRELPEARELRRPGSINLVEDTQVWGDRVRPIARAGEPVAPLLIDEFEAQPADDPVVGPELAAARTRLALTVDQLADRTRIRPHVIESIEVDDFAPCGGDFYARGHLRTLARVLGIDVAPLLASYDERYADAPINPRRVFEAELATGSHGSIRGTRGGPNWSVLIAAVMTLVLAWSIARLVMDSPVDLHTTPVLNGSGGSHSFQQLGDPVPVVITAAGGGAQVIVRDGAGEIAFRGPLSFGESRTLKDVAPPVRVQSSDGSLQVSVDGEDHGALGATGEPAQDTFTVR
ncbi:helix-turn-helix transcriptional regulator [Nocardioides sp. LS1]|uniref:helix-turn-helix domain-containing protein n=1 Tax=Nocardioides sp. LS1 TaxID=1027620 RepID=UPI001C8B2AA4|nr:helix-turn-helix transcriptional regulator [Nocardioides sp. LS1]